MTGICTNVAIYASFSPVPPTITPHPIDVTITEGTPHTLTCTATGEPLPLITWSRGGEVLSTQGSLSLEPSAQRSNAGTYTCTATNTAGSDSVDITVDVLCECMLPNVCTGMVCTGMACRVMATKLFTRDIGFTVVRTLGPHPLVIANHCHAYFIKKCRLQRSSLPLLSSPQTLPPSPRHHSHKQHTSTPLCSSSVSPTVTQTPSSRGIFRGTPLQGPRGTYSPLPWQQGIMLGSTHV